MHEACREGAEGRQLFAMDRVDLIGLEPPRHVAQDGCAHTRAGKHELPEGLFVKTHETGLSCGNERVGGLDSLEQGHFSEGVASTLNEDLRRLALLPCLMDLQLTTEKDVKAIACGARGRDLDASFGFDQLDGAETFQVFFLQFGEDGNL